jgi:hypothetical protein
MKILQQIWVAGVCLLPLAAMAEDYGSGWYGELQASAGFENNISRSTITEVDDYLATLSVGGGYAGKVGQRAQIVLSGYLSRRVHNEYDALDNLAVSAGLDYTFQPVIGYGLPWYRVALRLTQFQYDDSVSREGTLLETDLGGSKRLSPLVTGHIGLRYAKHFFLNQSVSDDLRDAAFKRDAIGFYLGGDFQLRDWGTLFSEFEVRHGDVLSTVVGGPRNGQVTNNPAFDAISPDTLFDKSCVQNCVAGIAYRARGDTYVATLGLTVPLTFVNVSVSAQWIKNDVEFADYEDLRVTAGVRWQF